MKKLIVAVIIAVVLIISAQTNPTKGEFVVWAKEKLKKESKNKYIDFGLDLLGDKLISSATTTHNYKFFSLYEVRVLNKQVKVIGVFDHFIPISKSDIK
ncbi:DUF4359 domain-containing protein [Bacillus sp. EAC]|uniref:DUF4359 domain-containing protein n=1 Tax=Bacillus sp. EAC TaxID=1978338 RepID=UPI000B43C0A2|nr:DUF4359 domain-containing protein [Bacillus sp. EAC]